MDWVVCVTYAREKCSQGFGGKTQKIYIT